MGILSEHEHLTVDADTYWGLLDLHFAAQTMARDGEPLPELLAHYSEEAESKLVRTRSRNELDPAHHEAEWRRRAVLDFVRYVATSAAYNGAPDPGQRFYDWALNSWLYDTAETFLAAPTQDPTP